MSEGLPRWVWVSAAVALIVLLWIFAYALPRMNEIGELEAANAAFERDRGRIAEALASYAGLRRALPEPTPNTSGWIASNAITGLENHLDFNNPYKNGQGSHVKFRNLRAEQVARFLSALRRVNVVVNTMSLQDRDGDGRWDLELMVEVPAT